MGAVTQRAMEKKRPYVVMMAATVLIVAAVDQAVKAIMLAWLEPGVPQPVVGDWFRFLLLFNPGAAFSMGQNSTWLFTCFQIAFVVAVAVAAPRVRDPWTAVGLALVGGGALGNLLDRLLRAPQFFLGHVVDFISVGGFAVFNIADACITVGVVIFLIGMLLAERGTKEVG
ncbi:signal peptidase II [Corynebacterium sp. zg-331]|uniref:signal peptidase II n=1 Tax=unclassified Corynebacterium TaxID=2624378 RepID=UPI00128DEDDC|nr:MULTISPECIES: signal peptidase II [unclassified Corynebacterium]MBC3185246.1 signal peptidase II [Corynebacterium sp. zg-331]MPV51744.1 signal peptidase II [Corynebacterium sp. zg331]